MAMPQWKCDFSVNGKRTQTIVEANSSLDAKKIVEAQFWQQNPLVELLSRLIKTDNIFSGKACRNRSASSFLKDFHGKPTLIIFARLF